MLAVLSVGEVTGYLRELMESDDLLRDVWVRGEVSNLVQSQAGHSYFTLKDSTSQLRCVIFRGQLPHISFRPRNGLAVAAHGRVSVYEVSGQVQLYVDLVEPQGVGELYLRFQQLRQRLEREGLFDPARKRPLPLFPRRIGVVTSPTGAVFHDIMQVVSRRFANVEIVLAPAQVQGEGAAESIAAAIAALNALPGTDVIILARGGGSLEDLWPFNEETVARAVFASRVPVVSGVGHETDVTIADLVADLRAPTPSAAAELVVPDRRDYLERTRALRQQAVAAVSAFLEAWRTDLEQSQADLVHLVPPPRLAQWRQREDELWLRASTAVSHAFALWQARVEANALQLGALSPMGVLGRGYSICWHPANGQPVKSLQQIGPGDKVEIQVADGIFGAAVSGHLPAARKEMSSPPGR
ncbi:MAG: exodeoxyribonuclease VII large subunit [Chloroflexota bacterium]